MEYITRRMQTFRSGKTMIDQFYIDDDYNVPDAKSDVKEIIMAEGTLNIEDMKVVENYIWAAGKLNFKVLYITEEGSGRLASLEGRIPFEEMIYLEQEPQGNLIIKAKEADLTVTAIHSRKLNIKTLAEITLACEGMQESEITMDIDSDIPIYKKIEEKELLKVYWSGKDTYRIKEEIVLNGTKENIGNMLWTNVDSRKMDTRLKEDELQIQGELMVFCLYETLDGKTDWISQTVPYEGRIACSGAQESMYHHMNSELTDVNIETRMDENGEMRLIGVEATLEIRMVIYEEEKLNILSDLYSLERVCVPTAGELQLEQLLMQNHSKCRVTEQLSLPEIKDSILQICQSSARIQLERTTPTDGGIQIEGVLHLSFLYIKADDMAPFDTWQGMVPFSYLMESNETTEDMVCDLTYTVEQLSIGLLGSEEVEVKAVLAFHSFIRRPVTITNIESVDFEAVNMEEVEKRPGITGYIVREGDVLWDLAKRYSTTVEGIMEINHLEKEEIKSGDKILIFKENMSIL